MGCEREQEDMRCAESVRSTQQIHVKNKPDKLEKQLHRMNEQKNRVEDQSSSDSSSKKEGQDQKRNNKAMKNILDRSCTNTRAHACTETHICAPNSKCIFSRIQKKNTEKTNKHGLSDLGSKYEMQYQSQQIWTGTMECGWSA